MRVFQDGAERTGASSGRLPMTTGFRSCLTSLKKTDVRTFVNAIGQVINRTPLAVSDPWQVISVAGSVEQEAAAAP